jgi:hypothetical protein
VPSEPAKAHTMQRVGIIQTWILSFKTVETSIETCCLAPHFWHQLASEEVVKALGIVGSWVGEHALIKQMINRLALHFGVSVMSVDRRQT